MGDGSDKIEGVQRLSKKKLPKLFQELFEDNKLTLDRLFTICEEKHNQHVIYSRIIFNSDSVKTNYKVMNLETPMLGDQEKIHILNCINELAYKLDIPTFTKMYYEDGLNNVLKNVDYWLKDNWITIDRYNRTKIK